MSAMHSRYIKNKVEGAAFTKTVCWIRFHTSNARMGSNQPERNNKDREQQRGLQQQATTG